MNDELYQRFLAEIRSLVAALKSFKTFVDSVDEAEVEKGTAIQMEAIKAAMDALHDGLESL